MKKVLFGCRGILALLAALCPVVVSLPSLAGQASGIGLQPVELDDEATCRIVESAASAAGVPVALLSRLIWTESRFRPEATSLAGAQGIAQFMPGTAAERGLIDPFDPARAIPEAARFLADLAFRFGNFGLAAAAYNAGPARVAAWLAGWDNMPAQTRDYVLAVTGHTLDEWASEGRDASRVDELFGRPSCPAVIAEFRARGAEAAFRAPAVGARSEASVLETAALVSFERARQRYCRTLRAGAPIIGGRVPPGAGNLRNPLVGDRLCGS